MPLSLVLALIIALFPFSALAHSEKPQYNRVSLNESAQTEVDNDLLVAVLFAQAEGRDAPAPADEVNRMMDWAVAMAKSHAGVKVQTLTPESLGVSPADSNTLKVSSPGQSLAMMRRVRSPLPAS